ncbi:hypothetical protein BHM03_00046736, partial [Ensete ventricosum]
MWPSLHAQLHCLLLLLLLPRTLSSVESTEKAGSHILDSDRDTASCVGTDGCSLQLLITRLRVRQWSAWEMVSVAGFKSFAVPKRKCHLKNGGRK